MSAAGPPSAADLATARMGLRADVDCTRREVQAELLVDFPVVPPECVIDFQGRSRESAAIRAVITAAGELTDADVARSRTARGLWELSRSDAWRREDLRGLTIDYPEFRELLERGANHKP